jgi:hypothetical protein
MSYFLSLLLFFFLCSNAMAGPPKAAPATTVAAPSTVLLLAHRWEAKSTVLDLNIDGTFEGRLPNGAELYGLWEMKQDRKTLVLVNDPTDEEEFEVRYQVLEVSFDQLRLKDEQGETTTLYLSE